MDTLPPARPATLTPFQSGSLSATPVGSTKPLPTGMVVPLGTPTADVTSPPGHTEPEEFTWASPVTALAPVGSVSTPTGQHLSLGQVITGKPRSAGATTLPASRTERSHSSSAPLPSGVKSVECPNRSSEDFRIYIVTWNVASAEPPDEVTSLLGMNGCDGKPDMYIIGLQEMSSLISKRLKGSVCSDLWTEHFTETMSAQGYVLVTSERMQGVMLLVFARYRHLPYLRGIETERTRTGLGGYWGNKGGVSARMCVFGHSVCFLNCHLPAHLQNLSQRMEDFESILQQQQFSSGGGMGVLDHDLVFWFGDLNFRIEGFDPQVVKSAISGGMLSLLWQKDQLNLAKETEPVLRGFTEGLLNFPPTYKFDVGTHTYDTSAKKRKPAWTDRILWRLRSADSSGPAQLGSVRRGVTSWLGHRMQVTQGSYRSHMGYTLSDHKPVSASFSLQFPFKMDEPLVTLRACARWTAPADRRVRFTLSPSYSHSCCDWIGLYQLGFRHHKDHVACVCVRQKSEEQVTFPEEELPRGAGQYVLGYYSNNLNSMVAVTEPFQIVLPRRSVCDQPSGHQRTSNSSSEDESFLALLPPVGGSRSPSSQPRQSRNPALTSLQGLNIRHRPRNARSPSPRASARRRHRLLSPDSPLSPSRAGGEATAPQALIAAILGDHRLVKE